MCEEWVNSFEKFLFDMGEKPRGCSIDRIDNNKGYCKDNCRWSTPREQANNRRPGQLSKNNKSGSKGVSYCSKCGKWEAKLCGKFLGYSDTIEGAALLRESHLEL